MSVNSGTLRTRTTQQDNQWKTVLILVKLEYVIEDKFDKDGSGLFAILDGHGGGEVS